MKKRLSVIITVLVSVVSSCVFFVTPLKAQLVFPLIVNTTSDTVVAGACQQGNPQPGCSLRGAIQRANEAANNDLIIIAIPESSDPNCVAGVCTINLTGLLPNISGPVSITGPGADKLTVRRNTGGNYGVFIALTTIGSVNFSGLTISNGVVSSGGGIFHSGSGTVNVTNCTLSNNTATGNSASNGAAFAMPPAH